MPTTKTRINVSLPDEMRQALSKIAKRDSIPEATKAARLIEIALELEEDKIWDEVAGKRDKKSARFVPHQKAWK